MGQQNSLAVWYIAYKDVPKAAFVKNLIRKRAREETLTDIDLAIATVAARKCYGCRPSYRHKLPDNNFDDRNEPCAAYASILRHVYHNVVQ